MLQEELAGLEKSIGRRTRAAHRLPSFLLLCAVIVVSACAKVGDPLPPAVNLPAGTDRLGIRGTANRVRLFFPEPGYRVEWVEIYKHCNPSAPLARFQLIARLEQDELKEAAEPGFLVFSEREGNPVCRYAVRFVDARGQKSEFSNLVSMAGNTP